MRGAAGFRVVRPPRPAVSASRRPGQPSRQEYSRSTGVDRPKIDTATLSRAFLVDLLDRAVEGRERTVKDPHLLADLEGDRRLRPLSPS
jgi:hypothetical protein